MHAHDRPFSGFLSQLLLLLYYYYLIDMVEWRANWKLIKIKLYFVFLDRCLIVDEKLNFYLNNFVKYVL